MGIVGITRHGETPARQLYEVAVGDEIVHLGRNLHFWGMSVRLGQLPLLSMATYRSRRSILRSSTGF